MIISRSGRAFTGVFAAVALAGCARASVPASASPGQAHGWRVSVLRAIAGYPVSEAWAVSCAGGPCVAAGWASGVMAPEIDSKGQPYFLATGSAGRWAPEAPGPLPAGAPAWNAPESGVNVSGISCSARGSCVAVGVYNSGLTTPSEPAFIAEEQHGSWHTALRPALPANAATPANAVLTSVSCASPGNCEAIGSYYTAAGKVQLSVTESHGRWAHAWPMRFGQPTGQGGLQSVSCASVSECVAVGWAAAAGKPNVVLTALRVKGRWQKAERIRLPRGSGSVTTLRSVSCLPTDICTAIGQSSSGTQVFVTFSRGRWGKPVALRRLPRGARGDGVALQAVSCARHFCLAVGSFTPTGLNRQEWLVVRIAAGTWRSAAEIRVPPGPAGELIPQATADAVSCTLAGICAVAGFYTDKSADWAALVATGS